MASLSSFLIFFIALLIASCNFTLLASHKTMHVSTISAAPTVLPSVDSPPSSSSSSSSSSPMVSPTLSPDIEPLFPTPGSAAFTPSESSLPTIPSSPSPPNPDSITSPGGSVMAFPPSESMPALAPSSIAASQDQLSSILLHLALLVFCILHFQDIFLALWH
ncbi:hypothetical protein HN51_048865 [Arachis hypogaea]